MAKPKKITEKNSWFIIILNRYYKYLIIFLSLVILSGAGFFWLKPKYQDVLKLSGENLPLRQERLEELEKYYNELQGLKEKLESFQFKNQQNLEKLKKILPSETGLADLFAQLEALITYRNKFVLNSISFTRVDLIKKTGAKQDNEGAVIGEKGQNVEADSDQAPGIGAIDISLNLAGSGYLDFKELLGDIEKHLRVMDVTSINFSDIYIDPLEDQKANYSVTLRTYYAK